MTRQTFPNVEPIWAGYDSPISVAFDPTFWAAFDMATGRLVAQFRRSAEGDVLFQADTADSSIERSGSNGLTITIPASSTAQFIGHALFDFVRIDGSARRVIPGLWQWPVSRPVTRDVG